MAAHARQVAKPKDAAAKRMRDNVEQAVNVSHVLLHSIPPPDKEEEEEKVDEDEQ